MFKIPLHILGFIGIEEEEKSKIKRPLAIRGKWAKS